MTTIKEILESGEIKDINDLFKSGKKPTIKEILEYGLFQSKCKNPISVVIQDIFGDYISGWNRPPKFIKRDKRLREDYSLGEGIEHCPGIHAGKSAISIASNKLISLYKGILYMSEGIPYPDSAELIVKEKIKKVVTPSRVYSNKKERILVSRLRNRPENFEMAEKFLREANIEIIVDPSIRPDCYTKKK